MACYKSEIFMDAGALADLECPICYNIMYNPVMDHNRHCFGEPCIQHHVTVSNKNCPMCREVLKIPLDPAQHLREKLATLDVRCQHYELCPWEGKHAGLDAHLRNECQHQPLPCPFANCKVTLVRAELDGHIQSCEMRPVPCPLCTTPTIQSNITNHFGTDCPEFEIDCSLQCSQKFARKLDTYHKTETCQNRVLNCRFQANGCQFKGKMSEIEHHMQVAAFLHIELLSQQLQKVQVMREGISDYVQLTEDLVNSMTPDTLDATKSTLKDSLRQIKELPNHKGSFKGAQWSLPPGVKVYSLAGDRVLAESTDANMEMVFVQQHFNPYTQMVIGANRGLQGIIPARAVIGFANKMVVSQSKSRVFQPGNPDLMIGISFGLEPVQGLHHLKSEPTQPVILEYLTRDNKVVLTNPQTGQSIDIDAKLDMNVWQPFVAVSGNVKLCLLSFGERSWEP